MSCSRGHVQVKTPNNLTVSFAHLCGICCMSVFLMTSFDFYCSAIDIKELKILDISNGNAKTNTFASAKVSTPVAVPKADPRSVEKLNSPQHCSKSYGERHLDVPGQPKGFRRRHNSCKY